MAFLDLNNAAVEMTVAPIDGWFARLRELSVFRGRLPRHVRLVVCERPADGTRLGECVARGKHGEITVFTYAGLTQASILVTLLHELAHLSGCWHHDRAFRLRLLGAAEEAFGASFPAAVRRQLLTSRGHQQLDRALLLLASRSLWREGTAPDPLDLLVGGWALFRLFPWRKP